MSRYTIKHWTGAPGERFTYQDLNRLIDIAKDLSRRSGSTGEDGYFTFIHYATHESQLEADVMWNFEMEVQSLSRSYGSKREYRAKNQRPGRVISYTDWNDIESVFEYLDTIYPN